jgi:hypothetical protein
MKGDAIKPKRILRITLVVILAFLAACSSAAVPSKNASSVSPSQSSLSVTSSLKDGAQLTGAIEWNAQVTPATDVSAVDFFIDGKIRWTETNAPYVFNDDHQLLATWLIGSGSHTLMVQATNSAGATASSTSHVVVVAVPSVPASLIGNFRRTVTQADMDRTASLPGVDPSGRAPTGVWTIHVRSNGLISFDDPQGTGVNETFSATNAGQVTFWGPANWLSPADRRGGFGDADRVDHFHWSVSGKVLTISGGGRLCADREAVLISNWTRI